MPPDPRRRRYSPLEEELYRLGGIGQVPRRDADLQGSVYGNGNPAQAPRPDLRAATTATGNVGGRQVSPPPVTGNAFAALPRPSADANPALVQDAQAVNARTAVAPAGAPAPRATGYGLVSARPVQPNSSFATAPGQTSFFNGAPVAPGATVGQGQYGSSVFEAAPANSEGGSYTGSKTARFVGPDEAARTKLVGPAASLSGPVPLVPPAQAPTGQLPAADWAANKRALRDLYPDVFKDGSDQNKRFVEAFNASGGDQKGAVDLAHSLFRPSTNTASTGSVTPNLKDLNDPAANAAIAAANAGVQQRTDARRQQAEAGALAGLGFNPDKPPSDARIAGANVGNAVVGIPRAIGSAVASVARPVASFVSGFTGIQPQVGMTDTQIAATPGVPARGPAPDSRKPWPVPRRGTTRSPTCRR